MKGLTGLRVYGFDGLWRVHGFTGWKKIWRVDGLKENVENTGSKGWGLTGWRVDGLTGLGFTGLTGSRVDGLMGSGFRV